MKISTKYYLVCLLAALILGGCQTMDKATDMVKSAMPGGDKLEAATLSEQLVGNTAIDVDGKWYSYLDDDGGAKMWSIDTGVKEGSWRRDDDGALCQTMDGVESCLSDAAVSMEDGVYHVTTSDGKEMSYRIVSGNSKDL